MTRWSVGLLWLFRFESHTGEDSHPPYIYTSTHMVIVMSFIREVPLTAAHFQPQRLTLLCQREQNTLDTHWHKTSGLSQMNMSPVCALSVWSVCACVCVWVSVLPFLPSSSLISGSTSCVLEQMRRSWQRRASSLQAFGAAVKTDGCVPPSDSEPKNDCGTPRYGQSAWKESERSVLICSSHRSRTSAG